MTVTCISAAAKACLATQGAATVHSVYKNTVNLKVGETLISLCSAGTPMTPMAIRTDADSGRLQELFSPGQRVTLSPAELRIGKTAIPVPTDCPTYTGSLPSAAAPEKQAFRALLEETLREKRPADFVFDPPGDAAGVLRLMRERAAEMLHSAKEHHLFSPAAFLGFGPGLTPSGDDFVTGVLAALELYGREHLRKPFAGETANNLSATGDISAALLSHAVEGRYSEPLLNLLRQPLSKAAATTAASVGHSSGCDAIFGILFALKYII